MHSLTSILTSLVFTMVTAVTMNSWQSALSFVHESQVSTERFSNKSPDVEKNVGHETAVKYSPSFPKRDENDLEHVGY